jgi:uncharacterized RDD family membrane protein YckC
MEGGISESSIRLRRLGALLIDVGPLWFLSAMVPVDSPIARIGDIPLILAYRMSFAALGRDTIGKSILGLTVLSRRSERPSRLRVIARDVPYLVIWIAAIVVEVVVRTDANATAFDEVKPALVMLMLINVACWDLVVALVTGKYSLHDFLARTRVADAGGSLAATSA